ncbi:MAG: hypothetical protein Q9212_007383, partial [Teloschistes hypoglaucus]
MDSNGPQHEAMFGRIYQSFKEGRWTDLTITCRGQKFECHKAVVCSQVKFFDAACRNGLKESETSTIDLPEDDPKLVKFMLHFLYGQIDGFKVADPDEDLTGYECLKASFGLIMLADKYDIPDLKAYGESCFHRILDVSSDYLPDLLGLIPCMYVELKDQNRHLQHAMVHELLRHPGKMLRGEAKVQMMDLMHTIPEFRQQ